MSDCIEIALTGTITADPTMRATRDGEPWLTFTVLVQVGLDKQWVSVAYFGDDVIEVEPQLQKDRRVRVDGKLTLRRWIGTDGRDKSGLAVTATGVELIARTKSVTQRDAPVTQRDATERTKKHRRFPSAAVADFAKPRATDQRAAQVVDMPGNAALTADQQAILF